MAPWEDVALFSLAALLGTIGVSITGFGHAILFIFVWQIAVLSGWTSDFKFSVFIQALALFSAQPLLLYKAEIRKHASRRMLYYFIPITVLSTPLGQITGDRVSTELVEMIGGVLVSFVAVFEVYQKRALFASWFCGWRRKKSQAETPSNEKGPEETTEMKDISSSSNSDRNSDVPSFSGTYHLGKKLGEGAFSLVKEGVHKTTGQVYAIKVVEKDKLLEVEEEKLKEEIDLLQGLSHANILELVDTFNETDCYYLVTEMMTGGDLLERLNGINFFGEKRGRQIVKSVLGAVQYLHSKKIAHRDLKPENVLLSSDSDNAEVKLADFGFAKKETTPNSFVTMCGTPSYVAPEILSRMAYGLKADLWSLGVVTYVLLSGYQPFHGDDEDEVSHKIRAGSFEFEEKFWGKMAPELKTFIESLLKVDPLSRSSADQAAQHPWFSLKYEDKSASQENEDPVFFMIGSQRSGSNWLRTMLDQREDLAGPHPPHMMRDFTGILDKFGDLSGDENRQVLVDHVCTFVERNQVPWTDKHGANVKFPRQLIYEKATASCERVKKNRNDAGDTRPLESNVYLLSIFDAIMNFYTKVNGKRLWMCKSMGMSKFHDILLEFYGEKRLRYIYLVRDPRDVAMSFMKTPVGDCHYYAIVSKWTKLQDHALKILDSHPHLVHKLHYESILKDKENVVKGVYEFIGERRFGGVKRQASVMFMNPTEELIDGAKKGREAEKARFLSYQFQNLGRGESFAKTQNQKWKDPETGLKDDEIQLIESIAYETMEKFGYKTHLVGVTSTPTVFSEADIKKFGELNQEGINKMNEDLEKENPGDFERRKRQSETLTFLPTLLEDWSESSESLHEYITEAGTSFLSPSDLNDRRVTESDRASHFSNGRRFVWSTTTQRGYYPQEKDKPNQDSSCAFLDAARKGGTHWFSVLDGHGPDGHKCAELSATKIPELFRASINDGDGINAALTQSHLTAHELTLSDQDIDGSMSGTTSVVLLLDADKCKVSNVGDSACILGSRLQNGSTTAKHLVSEHTPLRADERTRIKKAGGVVMTVDQRDGLSPMHENWDEHEAPPRVWSPQNDKFPGCGFTRSIGDAVAHTLGVTARPEIFEQDLDENAHVLIVASDGLTEFLSAEECVEIACRYDSPQQACRALIDESSRRWIDKGDYMDDITATVIFLHKTQSNGESTDLERGETKAMVNGDEQESQPELGLKAKFWTLFAGAASGFLGGLCGIRGPPIILYFLHPPYPVSFDKKSQRATGASITATNVAMRVAYYLVNTFAFEGDDHFEKSDWQLYLSVVVFSVLGVVIGSKIFEHLKDSRATIRGILAIFLILCGASLLISSFANI